MMTLDERVERANAEREQRLQAAQLELEGRVARADAARDVRLGLRRIRLQMADLAYATEWAAKGSAELAAALQELGGIGVDHGAEPASAAAVRVTSAALLEEFASYGVEVRPNDSADAAAYAMRGMFPGLDGQPRPARAWTLPDAPQPIRPLKAREHALPLTLTEGTYTIWGDAPFAAKLLKGSGLIGRLEEVGKVLRLTAAERKQLRHDMAKGLGVDRVGRAWMRRTGADEELWKEAQAHAWRTLRRGT